MSLFSLRSVHPAKISTKLVLFFTTILIVQTMTSIMSLWWLNNRSSEDGLKRDLSNSLTGTNQYVKNLINDMEIKADLFAAQQKVIDYSEFGLYNLLRRELTVLLQSLEMDSMGIFDAEGQPLLMVNADLSGFQGMESYVRRSIFDDSQSRVLHNPDEVQLFVCAPIKREEFLIGVLVIGKRLDRHFVSGIEQLTSAPTIYVHENKIVHSDMISYDFIYDYIAPNLGELRKGNPLRKKDYLIQGRLSSSGVDNPGFFINVGDLENSQQVVQVYNIISMILFLAVLLVALLLAVRFYNVTILKPIDEILEGISGIASGNFKPPFENPGVDEFGKVAKAFNNMCRNLIRRDEELDKLSRFNSMVLENIPSGILTVNREFQITSANPALRRLIGQEDDQELQKALLSHTPSPQWIEIHQIVQKGLLEEEYVFATQVNMSNQGNRILSISSAPLYSGVQEYMGIILILNDISQLKRMEEKLNTSSRLAALGEMAAGVAHQVKNPLTVIKLSMEMLQDGLQKSGITEHNDMINFVLEEVTSLDHFVRTFLDFSHLPRKKQAFYSLLELVRYSVSHLSMEQYPNVDINYHDLNEELRIFGDKNLLVQALSNLLLNAIQACKDEGHINIRGKAVDKGMELEIEDNGKGMSPDTKNKIFNPFFTTKDNGTGLGLSIVHRIIEEHNGSIEVFSKIGQGTRFVIHFNE